MPVIYQLNSSRVSLREYSWEIPWVLWPVMMPLVILVKLFRVRIPGSTDDQPVESTREFEVSPESVPAEVQLKFAPYIEELAQQGFHSLVFHKIVIDRSATTTYWVHSIHRSGRAVARVQYRVWEGVKPAKEFFFLTYFSEFQDGRFVVTTAGKPDMVIPNSIRTVRMCGAAASALWQTHEQEITRESTHHGMKLTHSHSELLDLIERHHVVLRDFHLRRGVFEPMPEESKSPVTTSGSVPVTAALSTGPSETTSEPAVPAESVQHADVLSELEQLQQQRVSWLNMLLVLAISLVLFLAAGFKDDKWQMLLLFVAVLFFHEMGHFVAMRCFGYRNLRMFFIPFFGAAVTGQHYNVAGWKKTTVSLMGPVPGIALGVCVGIAGIILDQKQVMAAAVVLVGLNGLNLLPFLPLDGGWVLHSTLFCRHPVLDVGFKLLAALLLFAIGILGLGKLFFFLGVSLLFSLPSAYRVAQIAADLRQRGVSQAVTDAGRIPVETALLIIDEVKRSFPASLNSKLIAQYTVRIFETLNARPPNWLATILLLGIHGCSLFVALIAGLVFVGASNEHVREVLGMGVPRPRHTYAANSSQSWRGPQASPQAEGKRVILVADFSEASTAKAVYQEIVDQQTANAAVTLFGESVFVTLVGAGKDSITRYEQQLKKRASEHVVRQVSVTHRYGQLRSDQFLTLRLTASAPDDDTAAEIKGQVERYLVPLPRANLIPPWSQEDRRSAQERAQHEKFRGVLQRAVDASRNAFSDPRCITARNRVFEKVRGKNEEEINVANQECTRILREVLAEKLEAMRKNASDPQEIELINLYVAIHSADPRDFAAVDQNWLEIGRRLGQLTMQGDEPAPGESRFSARHGVVQQRGDALELDWVQLESAEYSAPAIADWLIGQKCLDVRYEFISAEGDE